ncbi:hypothetical protein GALL_55370 [mine drainage metagenome]|uniref:SIR2-like domain-containing protein n=1 Tax=mine drainage metagenome TaxID=410659 RepID=A0A1J5SX83_9ZZZZ
MVKNITYLLGAGASANCLPVIDEMPKRLNILKAELNIRSKAVFVNNPGNDVFAGEDDISNARTLVADLEWLSGEIQKHKTVDTLAKKFYLIKSKNADLKKLKKVLIAYFIYEQTKIGGEINSGAKEVPDKRYDSLIATIIDKKIGNLNLPTNFKIITWNYDLQFEIAYKEYLHEMSINDIQKKIQAIPSTEFIKRNTFFDYNKFSIVRLNGVAGLKIDLEGHLKRGSKTEKDDLKDFLASIARYYCNMPDDDIRVFNYSWENPDDYSDTYEETNTVKKIAKEIMRATDILVIIGYSFPVFNRSVDKELFGTLNRQTQIYIQDKNANEIQKLIIESFNTVFPDRIKAYNLVNQFFIPPEADI